MESRPLASKIEFINPKSRNPLLKTEDGWRDPNSQEIIAPIVDGIPRFVDFKDNYAESFGWQWNHWVDNRSTLRDSGFGLKELILARTKFDQFDLENKTLLECGCGGGDDTEALCSLPFSEIHSFDLSSAVERAKKNISDPRVVFSQASIYDIPYPDQSFDVVYCHRVLQHTPDPVKSLESICQKVKPGGILFAHAYKRSRRYMASWRYKYLWFTQKIPHKYIFWYVKNFGRPLHYLNKLLYRNSYTRTFAYRFIPFYHKGSQKDVQGLSENQVIDLERLITFDALTPAHDHPMSSEDFFGTIERCGFEIKFKHDPDGSPQYCTAIKK